MGGSPAARNSCTPSSRGACSLPSHKGNPASTSDFGQSGCGGANQSGKRQRLRSASYHQWGKGGGEEPSFSSFRRESSTGRSTRDIIKRLPSHRCAWLSHIGMWLPSVGKPKSGMAWRLQNETGE